MKLSKSDSKDFSIIREEKKTRFEINVILTRE